jgi:hypothetical protein
MPSSDSFISFSAWTDAYNPENNFDNKFNIGFKDEQASEYTEMLYPELCIRILII